jgi:hypothetical protein
MDVAETVPSGLLDEHFFRNVGRNAGAVVFNRED